MAQHARYWSCSKFADVIRGTKKLGSGTSDEWNNWYSMAAKKHNFRYWLAETALGKMQDFVTYPVRKFFDISCYFENRWVTRTHALTAAPADIKPGSWCDVGNRFLPCLFNSLVDFVEVEKAAANGVMGRDRYAGLSHLVWEMSLINDHEYQAPQKDYGKPTRQAIVAKEITCLYMWWTVTHRNRKEPMEASGWSAHCAALRTKYPGDTFYGMNGKAPADRKTGDKALKLMRKIEAEYDKEDEQMLVRLIKIRNSLWN